ncbi:SAM-dependent methyltransferase [Rhodococcus sp. AQ5-07]|uniref:SAM-dependent methyltransferase n=1 Tax=Rhodococcus sp. AQ5-07 TaxID=2054902 RepID=UPI000DBFE915|nr:class I SAM-dependent methyltransferase [Rhodococcus sp. AQ5-07]RAL30809.1 SAM-dependent methyltransferase [Rhodococcus sp. AQ5-07]
MRTDGESWDIASGVGVTALRAATYRALETLRPDALIEDRYAEWFVDAAHDPRFTSPLRDPTLVEDRPFGQCMGLRTTFFDDFFLTAAHTGIRQSVILGAGLDARTYRLEWPPGMTVFEIDMPAVLEFKEHVLAEHNARTKAHRRVVAVDLRGDWPEALVEAGFDPHTPAAWSAEGLLTYLPGRAHDELLVRIDQLSQPGSHLAFTTVPTGADPAALAAIRSKYSDVSPFGEGDITELIHTDARVDPAHWLTEHTWAVRQFSTDELASIYNRPPPVLPDELAAFSRQSTCTVALR